MKIIYRKVTFEQGEFEQKFPGIAGLLDLSESDKVRLALGLLPRFEDVGAQEGNNKNPQGRKGKREEI